MSRTKRAKPRPGPRKREPAIAVRVRGLERKYRAIEQSHDRIVRELGAVRQFTQETDFNLLEKFRGLRDRVEAIERRGPLSGPGELQNGDRSR